MNKKEMIKEYCILMVKNNPDEAVKNLLLLYKYKNIVDKALKFVEDITYSFDMNELKSILRGEINE